MIVGEYLGNSYKLNMFITSTSRWVSAGLPLLRDGDKKLNCDNDDGGSCKNEFVKAPLAPFNTNNNIKYKNMLIRCQTDK